jgi:hypothetical protein
MKRFIAFFLCMVALLCVTPVIAFAEGETPDTEVVEVEKPITEVIVDYVKAHLEELSVIVTLLVTIFYEVRRHGKLNGSIGTLNNNAIAIAENSSTTIRAALNEVADIAEVVRKYRDDFEALLNEVRVSSEEKKSLEQTLAEVETFLKTAKLATLELSNEVAELLVLANIPNSKKDELYARHTKAVHELEAVEGVINNDGTET